VTWLTTVPQANAVKTALNSKHLSSAVVPTHDSVGDTLMQSERAHSLELETSHPLHMLDEEVVASGWGGDGDGEDGMGML
jgi:hypothetical protein